MNEWTSALAVFWLLYLLDGIVVTPQPIHWFSNLWGRWRTTWHFSRLAWLPPSAALWRARAADPLFSVSPVGLCSFPSGSSGRPCDPPAKLQGWRWEAVEKVEEKDGNLFVNGTFFCHAPYPGAGSDLSSLAQRCKVAPPAERNALVRTWLRLSLRPIQLRRRAKVWLGRTRFIAFGNTCVTLGLGLVTVYLAGNIPALLSANAQLFLGHLLPAFLSGIGLLHAAVLFETWRLWCRMPTKRRPGATALVTATLLPPQGLRLRAILGEAWFPPSRPLAFALAFTNPAQLHTIAFQTLTDLRWPLPFPPAAEDQSGSNVLCAEITAWQRATLEETLRPLLKRASLDTALLLAPPVPDSAASCSYCPRCLDQFAKPVAVCARGIPVQTFQKLPASKSRHKA